MSAEPKSLSNWELLLTCMCRRKYKPVSLPDGLINFCETLILEGDQPSKLYYRDGLEWKMKDGLKDKWQWIQETILNGWTKGDIVCIGRVQSLSKGQGIHDALRSITISEFNEMMDAKSFRNYIALHQPFDLLQSSSFIVNVSRCLKVSLSEIKITSFVKSCSVTQKRNSAVHLPPKNQTESKNIQNTSGSTEVKLFPSLNTYLNQRLREIASELFSWLDNATVYAKIAPFNDESPYGCFQRLESISFELSWDKTRRVRLTHAGDMNFACLPIRAIKNIDGSLLDAAKSRAQRWERDKGIFTCQAGIACDTGFLVSSSSSASLNSGSWFSVPREIEQLNNAEVYPLRNCAGDLILSGKGEEKMRLGMNGRKSFNKGGLYSFPLKDILEFRKEVSLVKLKREEALKAFSKAQDEGVVLYDSSKVSALRTVLLEQHQHDNSSYLPSGNSTISYNKDFIQGVTWFGDSETHVVLDESNQLLECHKSGSPLKPSNHKRQREVRRAVRSIIDTALTQNSTLPPSSSNLSVICEGNNSKEPQNNSLPFFYEDGEVEAIRLSDGSVLTMALNSDFNPKLKHYSTPITTADSSRFASRKYSLSHQKDMSSNTASYMNSHSKKHSLSRIHGSCKEVNKALEDKKSNFLSTEKFILQEQGLKKKSLSSFPPHSPCSTNVSAEIKRQARLLEVEGNQNFWNANFDMFGNSDNNIPKRSDFCCNCTFKKKLKRYKASEVEQSQGKDHSYSIEVIFPNQSKMELQNPVSDESTLKDEEAVCNCICHEDGIHSSFGEEEQEQESFYEVSQDNIKNKTSSSIQDDTNISTSLNHTTSHYHPIHRRKFTQDDPPLSIPPSDLAGLIGSADPSIMRFKSCPGSLLNPVKVCYSCQAVLRRIRESRKDAVWEREDLFDARRRRLLLLQKHIDMPELGFKKTLCPSLPPIAQNLRYGRARSLMQQLKLDNSCNIVPDSYELNLDDGLTEGSIFEEDFERAYELC